MRKLAFVILTALLSVGMVFSQSSRGIVSGIIKDPNGAVVPGATVKLTNTSTTVERTVKLMIVGFIVSMQSSLDIIRCV